MVSCETTCSVDDNVKVDDDELSTSLTSLQDLDITTKSKLYYDDDTVPLVDELTASTALCTCSDESSVGNASMTNASTLKPKHRSLTTEDRK
jgi:hypothetical protein